MAGRRTTRVIAIAAVAISIGAGSVAGGRWWAPRFSASNVSAQAATAYICPMHPDYRSDHPGNCPICGMRLETDRQGAASGDDTGTRTPAHTGVRVTPESQQAIGVRIGVVTRSTSTQSLRTTGRVAADENRMYPIIAAVSGSIRSVSSVTTGDAVKKDQALASFFSPDSQLETAQQSYYEGLEMLYRNAGAPQAPSHLRSAVEEVERLADGLRSLGVSNSQVRLLATRRELVREIRVESPADGIVLQRNVSLGFRFDRGFEFYRIADLNRVWILADVSRHQLPFIRHGAKARITTGNDGRALAAMVSASEPIFDEATQMTKVRLEVANPKLALKPGMFVDVEFPIDLPPMLIVPADAIVNSGLRKTVFVDCGDGHFEPRQIETGLRIGDDVEVTKGLAPGERIVISGTFFIDSETRMKSTP
jgi:membrane fusion protein, copper/silver efflux system